MIQLLAIVVLLAGGLFLLPLVGAVFGAFTGWVVGLFFGDTILGICAQLGIRGVAMWQLGCFLGFVGGFFRTSLTTDKKE